MHTKTNQEKNGMPTLVSEREDFKARDKEGHYIIIKSCTCKEDITIFNVYAYNKRTSKYIRQINRTARRNR